MSTNFTNRREGFTPQPRPEWVARINAEGLGMDIKSVVPLDENSLIETAKRNTGLSDFGADDWHERFQRLITAFDEESELTLMGRLMTRSDMLLFLEGRLRIEDTYKQHPEIDDEQITQPIHVIGQGRSGTSFMQNLLSEDPGNGTPLHWEAMRPCPPPEKATYRTDPRIAQTRQLVELVNRVTPEVEAIHEMGVEIPEENHRLLCYAFGAAGWCSAFYGQVPSFTAYMQTQSMVPVYAYEKRVLKLLQWKNPRKHWVLKSPLCILDIPAILEVYPDSAMVWTHRDPVKALGSLVSTIGTLQWCRTDHPFIGDSLISFTSADAAAGMLSQPIGWLESGIIAPGQLYNLQYLDFVRDPLGSVSAIYDHFGIEMTEEGRRGMQQYLDDHPGSARPQHAYELHVDTIDLERAAFAEYQDYFQVPAEF
jgi:hypothetical protein